MKRNSFVLVSLFVSSFVFLLACTKIDTTTLGSELIPPVDNIHTFQAVLDVTSDNLTWVDSTAVVASDDLPIGYTNDPEFGQTNANLYFSVSAPAYKVYPFGKKDSVAADSIILSLAFKGSYGDTNLIQRFRVFEISQTAGFNDTTFYRLNQTDFATVGSELGNKNVDITKLNDSSQVVTGKDTSKVINVLRIPLSLAFANRLLNYDTVFSSTTGGYYSDSLFKTLFRGFAIQADQVGNALSYFNVSDANTKLIMYYHYKSKPDSTLATQFLHAPGGLTNSLGVSTVVKRTPGGGWNTYLTNGNPSDDLLYIPSSPGSYGLLKIPGLDTMSNKVIHLAELIMPKVPTADEDKFTPQAQLFLDMINNTGDTAFSIQNDFVISNLGGSNLSQFGGALLRHEGSLDYRFNISRHVQGIVTRHEPNFRFRVYAPLETNIYYLPPGTTFNRKNLGRINLPIVPKVGFGRVVLGGGANTNPAYKLRLRIVYSLI